MIMTEEKQTDKNSPIFNLPKGVVWLLVLIWLIFLIENYLLSAEQKDQFFYTFAFIPLLYISGQGVEGAAFSLIITPFSHALLHANWEHLFINSAWLAIFGTPVAYRYGTVKFLLIFFICAAAGALFFAVTTLAQLTILVGASGAISGLTGVAIRFIFQPVQMERDESSGEIIAIGRRLATFTEMMRNIRARSFILIWVGLNALIPVGEYLFDFGDFQIAWQAHLGGFFAGILIAPIFELKARANKRP